MINKETFLNTAFKTVLRNDLQNWFTPQVLLTVVFFSSSDQCFRSKEEKKIVNTQKLPEETNKLAKVRVHVRWVPDEDYEL